MKTTKKKSKKKSNRGRKAGGQNTRPLGDSFTARVVEAIDAGKFTCCTDLADELGCAVSTVYEAAKRWRPEVLKNE